MAIVDAGAGFASFSHIVKLSPEHQTEGSAGAGAPAQPLRPRSAERDLALRRPHVDPIDRRACHQLVAFDEQRELVQRQHCVGEALERFEPTSPLLARCGGRSGHCRQPAVVRCTAGSSREPGSVLQQPWWGRPSLASPPPSPVPGIWPSVSGRASGFASWCAAGGIWRTRAPGGRGAPAAGGGRLGGRHAARRGPSRTRPGQERFHGTRSGQITCSLRRGSHKRSASNPTPTVRCGPRNVAGEAG